MTAALLISGLGETATSFGQGMAPLAERLADEPMIDVTRWGYWQADEAANYAAAFENIALVGHSFGGSTIVEVARRLDRHCIIFGVDPVPRSAWQRWTKATIEVPDNVGRAFCLMRGTGFYPLSKRYSGAHVTVEVLHGADHNAAMRSIRTHQLIVDFVTSMAA